MKNRTLILGLVSKYPLYYIKPFFDSLKKAKYEGTTVIFANDVEPKVLQFLGREGVTCIHYQTEWPFVKDAALAPFIRHCNIDLSPNSLRYLFYNAFLNCFPNKFNQIMITDIRDVYFQLSPFDFEFKGGISVFLEDAGTPIGQQFHNRHWILSAFGQGVLQQLSEKPISCSGVTIGDYSSMSSYLSKMCDLICVKQNVPGLDQGIHNYLLHTHQIENVNIYGDDEGPVSTISFFKPRSKVKVQNGKVVGASGLTINIVHQYDRDWRLLVRWNIRYFITHQINLFKGSLFRLWQRIKGKASWD